MFKHCKRLLFLLVLTIGVTLACPIMAQAATTDADGNEIVVITIDPGHGAEEEGATRTYDGVVVKESELNWKIANYVKERLEADYWNVEVHLSREYDEGANRLERIQTALSYQSDFVLSIHLNAGTGDVCGALSLVPSGNYDPVNSAISTEVGDAILEELEGLGITNRGRLIRYSDEALYPDGSMADYYGIVRYGILLGVPSIIMEHAFLDNASDYYTFLNTDEKLQAIAAADARGLAKTLGLEAMSEKPTVRKTSADQGDTPFTDVYVGDWFYDDVTFVYEQKLMNGDTDSTFAPSVSTTRGMIATLLYRLEGEPETSGAQHFTDVTSEDWYYQSVEWAAEAGLAQGFEDGTFLPEEAVTREQMVTFLYRYAQYKGYDTTATGSLESFQDGASVSDYALEAMQWAVAVGLVKGVDDDRLDPQGETSRDQLATLFHRYILTVVNATEDADTGTDGETDLDTDSEAETEPEVDAAADTENEADNAQFNSASADSDSAWAAYVARNHLLPANS